jgi:PIN domain nuclease of toxin-antitoxin system
VSAYLVDTHAFLWFVSDDARLSPAARETIGNGENLRLFSMASMWEMSIKHSLGKLNIARPIDWAEIKSQVAALELEVLAVTEADVDAIATMPLHHRDPFDRMLVAQATRLGVPILTADVAFQSYPVSVTW